MTQDCIIVTGASRGIGAAIAYALASRGERVACFSRSGSVPQHPGATPEIKERWITRAVDVCDGQALRHAVGALAQEGLKITGLVNNAGIHKEGKSADLPLEQWHELMNTNALSVFMACQAVHPHFAAAGGGVIVNIGSFNDKLGIKRNVAYCASKAAVGAITRCLAVEWAKDGIRVINVAPGYVMTDINAALMEAGSLRSYLQQRIPRGEPGTPDEIGSLVALLFDRGASFLTGETVYVDGAHGIRN